MLHSSGISINLVFQMMNSWGIHGGMFAQFLSIKTNKNIVCTNSNHYVN